MKKKTNLNDELLVSETRHHSPHSYGLDLSLIAMQDERDEHEKSCHVCCLFATACPHFSSTDSHHSKRIDRTSWNENAIGTFVDIWKDSMINVAAMAASALVDVPDCFRENHSNESKKNVVSNTSLWQKRRLDEVCDRISRLTFSSLSI